MPNTSITFEPGSGRYESGAKIFRFNAYDGDRHVLCAISSEAFEALSGTLHLEAAWANVMFVSWEDDIFDIARAKYQAGDMQDGGTLVVRASDITARR